MSGPVSICPLCLKTWTVPQDVADWGGTSLESSFHADEAHGGDPAGQPVDAAALNLRGVFVSAVWAYAVRELGCDVIGKDWPWTPGQLLVICGLPDGSPPRSAGGAGQVELALVRSCLGRLRPREPLPPLDPSVIRRGEGAIAIARLRQVLARTDKPAGWQLPNVRGWQLDPVRPLAQARMLRGGGETLFPLSIEDKRAILRDLSEARP